MGLPGRDCCRFFLAFSALLLFASMAQADGGALRLSQEKDGYRIAVFTTPTPLRAGPVDFSVLVQDAATGELASGVQATIKAQREGDSPALYRPATAEAATNKLYYAATFDLAEPGWYSVEVSILGPLGETQVGFDVEAADPLPQGLTILPWVGWPLLAIAVFTAHQFLVKRKSQRKDYHRMALEFC
jgi:hypothetical protein